MQLNRSCQADAGDKYGVRFPDRARVDVREKENLAQRCHPPNGDRDQRVFDAGDHTSAKS
jgi:hypothetical protein